MDSYAKIVIESRTTIEDGGPVTDIKVGSEGIASQDELLVLLLTMIEKVTGVSTDDYVRAVDQARR